MAAMMWSPTGTRTRRLACSMTARMCILVPVSVIRSSLELRNSGHWPTCWIGKAGATRAGDSRGTALTPTGPMRDEFAGYSRAIRLPYRNRASSTASGRISRPSMRLDVSACAVA